MKGKIKKVIKENKSLFTFQEKNIIQKINIINNSIPSKMKKFLAVLVIVLGFTFHASAQTSKKVALEQTKGEFTQKSLTLSEGTYVFEIENSNVGHDVGFVLAPKGKTGEKHHIKNAYVTSLVKNNKKSKSKAVVLTKGEYVYFCPLNPTPQYTLIVK